MRIVYKLLATLFSSMFLLGCTSGIAPKPTISTRAIIAPSTTSIVTRDISSDSKYGGYPPQHYKESIKSYFSNKLGGAELSYIFSSPQKAFKRKGLAYGGDISWRGWLVDVQVISKSRTGRRLSPKPYMILFKNSLIVEDILGRKHTLLTRVGK